MKYLYLLLAALFIVSCTSNGTRGPSSQNRPKHHVITLHGVRGNLESYGDFHKIVKANLEAIDPSYEVEVEKYNWTYPVGKMVEVEGHAEWTPHEIANKLNEDFFLGANGKKPLIPELGPQDKISFIAYSMGGLMIMSWYYDTMFNFANTPSLRYSDATHQRLLGYLEKVDNIIGLGAVYWGSLDAELGWSMMENGDLSQIKAAVPKIQALCQTPEAKKLIGDQGLLPNISSLNPFSKKPEETPQQKRDKFITKSVIATCDAVNFLTGTTGSVVTQNLTSVNGTVLDGIKWVMKNGGNVSARELNNMRLTSDSINDMRLDRVKHLNLPGYKERFKAKWTNIVGVFPCLGKIDKGLTCKEFSSEEFKTVNQGLVTAFSGTVRRETDGPVLSPSATADFVYYTEAPGRETQNVSFESFHETKQEQAAAGVHNQDIFVENMHATVAPALEALPGILQNAGKKGAEEMLSFDASLGVDVVIVNKECAKPENCKHPNYKHILQALANCETGADMNPACNQNLMNRFYGVTDTSARLAPNDQLKEELGSFFLALNIRLPKSFKLTEATKANLLKSFKFQFQNYGKGFWNENRLDMASAPYEMQIARPSEIMSSYAYLRQYSDINVLRVFFVGRVRPKAGHEADGRDMMAKGLPVRFEIALPGTKNARRVVAKVKPTYTTYVDLFMK